MAGMESNQAGQDGGGVKRSVLKPVCSVRLVKELKGAPLSVWMALMCTRGVPVTQDWLVCNTGYTDKPIRQALFYLVQHGFVIQLRDGWMILKEDQEPLSIPLFENQDHGLMDSRDEDPKLDTEYPNRKNSDSPIININNDLNDSNDSINNNNHDRKNSDSTQRFSDFPDLGNALIDVGICENERTRRLLGRITPRDVRKMAAQIRDDPYHDLSETGLMVTILEGIAEKKQRQGGYESWNS